MAQVKLNPVLEGLHGQIGDLVFRRFQDQTVVARKPDQTNQPNSPAQQAVKDKFRLAAVYGKIVLADAAKAADYQARAREKGTPVFALLIADFLNAPVVDEIDLSGYAGKAGDVIKVRAHDDFAITGVEISIRDTGGTVLEHGPATLSSDDGCWRYPATVNLAAGQQVAIDVTASDRPGHQTTRTQQK